MAEFEVPDADTLMAELRRQQDQVTTLQESITGLRVKGYSRNNEVSVSVRGSGAVTEISIDPEVLRRYDAHDVGTIVAEAVNDALTRLASATKARFAPLLANLPKATS